MYVYVYVSISNDDAVIFWMVYFVSNFPEIVFTCTLQLEVDFVLLPTLKSVLIYQSVGTESVWMRVVAEHQYCYYLVATAACNGVQHSHSRLLGIPGAQVPIDLLKNVETFEKLSIY